MRGQNFLRLNLSTRVFERLSPVSGWNVWGELFSCSDDQTIHKWNPLGEPEGKVGKPPCHGRMQRCGAGPGVACPHFHRKYHFHFPLFKLVWEQSGDLSELHYGASCPSDHRPHARTASAPRAPLSCPSHHRLVQVCNLDAFYTDLMWYPVSSKKNQAGGTDVFAVSCTDGEQRKAHSWQQRTV